MRLIVEVLGSTFAYEVAFDDDLAALDWALHDLAAKRQLDSQAVLTSLTKGWNKRNDHSHLWRGGGVFPMLQRYAESLTSMPGSRLTLWMDPPFTVRLSFDARYVEMSIAEHDTVIVRFSDSSVSLECPIWVHGLNSWIDDFYRRLRTEDLWLVRTRLLGVTVRKDFHFDEDLHAPGAGGVITKSWDLVLPAALKDHA